MFGNQLLDGNFLEHHTAKSWLLRSPWGTFVWPQQIREFDTKLIISDLVFILSKYLKRSSKKIQT